MIAILNYQAGNLKSLINALGRHGLDAAVTADPAVVMAASLVILPGVGAFSDAALALETSGLGQVLKDRHACGKPILGICLGMQLFYQDSDEGQLTPGLGLMAGHIRRLSPGTPLSPGMPLSPGTPLSPDQAGLKVPHMGWNELLAGEGLKPTFSDFANSDMYFVHSYGLIGADPKETVFYADHGQLIPSMIYRPKSEMPLRGALMGFQFHPEKSGLIGEKLLMAAIEKEVS